MGRERREKLRLTKFQRKEIKLRLWNKSKKCGLCKKDLPGFDRSTFDHIKPLGKGGKDIEVNLQLTHWKCNNKKGDRLI